ncbi:MAG: hypothetical protein QOG23_3853 [Blastocatellia bacterium]|nr:hypothetical protein [Blastocatellia bacterium]
MPPQEFRDEHTPFGYLITFRSYGTWLHGQSGSVDRFHNAYGTPTLTERVRNAFKANSTRQMREAGCWKSERSPWAEGGSKRYLWTEEQLVNAIVYVQDDQGEPLD